MLFSFNASANITVNIIFSASTVSSTKPTVQPTIARTSHFSNVVPTKKLYPTGVHHYYSVNLSNLYLMSDDKV